MTYARLGSFSPPRPALNPRLEAPIAPDTTTSTTLLSTQTLQIICKHAQDVRTSFLLSSQSSKDNKNEVLTSIQRPGPRLGQVCETYLHPTCVAISTKTSSACFGYTSPTEICFVRLRTRWKDSLRHRCCCRRYENILSSSHWSSGKLATACNAFKMRQDETDNKSTVKFDTEQLPPILNALETENNGQKLILEVAVYTNATNTVGIRTDGVVATSW